MKPIAPLGRINIFNSSEFRDRINELIDAVNGMSAGGGSGGNAIVGDEENQHPVIPVRLTAKSTTSVGRWEFAEVLWSPQDGRWVDRTDGLTHEDLGEAMEMGRPQDGSSLCISKVNDVVYLLPREAYSGSLTIYEFQPTSVGSFWAKITGSASDGDNKWTYSFVEMARTSTGFEEVSGGRSSGTGNGARNSVEANNDDSGTQGNSVDIDGTIFGDNTGLEIQPVEGEPIVRMWEEYVTEGDSEYTLWTFEYVNAIDGACS